MRTLLRIIALVEMTAIGAVVMPQEWMAIIHKALGMGDLPEAPIMGYLTRSLSAFYALQGTLLMYLTFDLRRNLRVVAFLAKIGIVFGAAMLAIDCAVGMPLFWKLGEGPVIIIMCCVILWLAARVKQDDKFLQATANKR
ncbi:MAG: hypothetical protein NTX50_02275 [Candidatus Sumerlaeota bacterium]|nr:hypothetical protein [Candidatus Sumerlaeota bacterium]